MANSLPDATGYSGEAEIHQTRWVDGELAPDDAWFEIQRRGIAKGLTGQVITAALAQQLYPKAEYLASKHPKSFRC
jgi:hypothetical protein